jgi:hypothetical protein
VSQKRKTTSSASHHKDEKKKRKEEGARRTSKAVAKGFLEGKTETVKMDTVFKDSFL